MAIVPSGRRRLMKTQQNQRLIDSDPDAMQIEYSEEPRTGPSFDFGGLQDQLGREEENNGVPSQEDLEGAVGGGLEFPGQGADVGVSEGNDGLGQKGQNIRDIVFQTLEGLGVPQRFISANGDALFKGEKDLSTGQLKGHFMIPTYTQGSQIDQSQAEKIASQIGQKFGLQLKISHEKNNYRISFQTQDLKPEGIGSSLDQLVGGQQGGAENFQRGAQTTAEMIKEAHSKEARSKLAETLISKLGLGE